MTTADSGLNHHLITSYREKKKSKCFIFMCALHLNDTLSKLHNTYEQRHERGHSRSAKTNAFRT